MKFIIMFVFLIFIVLILYSYHNNTLNLYVGSVQYGRMILFIKNYNSTISEYTVPTLNLFIPKHQKINVKINIIDEEYNDNKKYNKDLFIVSNKTYPAKFQNCIYIPPYINYISHFMLEEINNSQIQIRDRQFCSFIHTDSTECSIFINVLEHKINKQINIVDYRSQDIFVIAFENKITNGYITEKILLPMIYGSIPIYRGSPDINNHFNEKRFINVDSFSSYEECVNYIISLSENDIENILKEPIYVNNKPNIYLSILDGNYKPLIDIIKKIQLFNTPYIEYIPFNTLLEWTSPIKVINLYKDIDRKNDILRQCYNLNIKVDFFNAINGKEYYKIIPKEWVKWDIFYNFFMKFTMGQIGVYLSHMELYSQLIQSNYEYIIILEDDVILSEKINEHKEIVNKAPKNWDFIFLGTSRAFCKNILETYEKLDCMPCAHAYIINRKGAQYMLQFSLPITMPIDNVFLYNKDNLNMYRYQDFIEQGTRGGQLSRTNNDDNL